MKIYLFLFFAVLSTAGFSQKETLVVKDARGIKSIILSSDEVYKVKVSTAPVNTITVKTKADGEYYDEIKLDMEQRGEILFLKSHYRKLLQSGYDKLSAHKVLSMEIELQIPEGLELDITSNLATVYVDGTYSSVFIQLKSGSCYIKDFTGDAIVNTFNGDIDVKAENALVEASSRKGKVELPSSDTGSNIIRLNSITGNIHVEKIK